MKRVLSILLIISLLFVGNTRADEGMWLLQFLKKQNYEKMRAMGLKLQPEDIYDINNSSLKDAIVIFGGGCTGEIISPEGLLLTNMHCGYSQVQSHSSVENDYLKDGFWAMNRDQELPNAGLSVKFLVKIEDVTNRMLFGISNEMSEEARAQKLKEHKEQIEAEAGSDNNYLAEVKAYFGGNQYYLSTFEVYNDVRLVGNPPVSISDFGNVTDNWMWPRHKADFALFRVYMSPDGKPADYNPENIPLQPKHFLPVSLKGVEKGDFSMILGNPGTTERYMPSYGIQEALNITNPNRIKIRGRKLEIINQAMDADPAVRIQYASKYKRSSNYWKYSIGQNIGLERLKVINKKQQQEDEFKKWVAQSDARKQLYGNILEKAEEAYTKRAQYANASQYIIESLYSGPELFAFAYQSANVIDAILNADNEEAAREAQKQLQTRADNFFKDYQPDIDRKVATALMEFFVEEINPEFYPEFLPADITKEQVSDLVDSFFDKTVFTDKKRFDSFVQSSDYEKLLNDPVAMAGISIINKYRMLWALQNQFDTILQQSERLYIKGLMEMEPDKLYYPDANFTMRYTYGQVFDYEPADGKMFKHYTTLKGVMEKEDPGNYEFNVPQKLKDLYLAKDYGKYGYDDEMRVCFITNNDITGGNSGSPMIGANGELIGLAFDGNWEGMSGDIAFEPDYQATIGVDIKYVLFIIDKFAGAGHLIQEMKLIE